MTSYKEQEVPLRHKQMEKHVENLSHLFATGSSCVFSKCCKTFCDTVNRKNVTVNSNVNDVNSCQAATASKLNVLAASAVSDRPFCFIAILFFF